MKRLLFTVILLSTLTLAGCQDKVELEERGFVGAFSVDSCEAGVTLGVELMRMPQDGEGEDNEDRKIKQATGKNFTDAMYELNYLNSKELDFALSKACILGEGLLEDSEKLRDVANALDQNSEICGKLLIIAARGDALDVLENIPSGENSVGEYISNYYKHRRNKASPATQLDLKAFSDAMANETGAVMPIISYDEDGGAFNFKSTVLVKEVLKGYTENDELAGLNWAKGTGRGRLLTVQTNDCYAAIRITSQQTRYNFRDEDNRTICSISVRASGTLEEEPEFFMGTDEQTAVLQRIFAKAIIEEIKEAYKFLTAYEIDGFELTERLQKRKPELYEKYGSPLGCTLEIKVSVSINN